MTTPFPQLDSEQEGAASLLARYDPGLGHAVKRQVAEEACRLLNQISQVREELIYPSCIGMAPSPLLVAAVIEGDLIRVLVAEVMLSHPSDLLYDGGVATLKATVRRRWTAEESPRGLWSLVAPGPFRRDLDIRLGERLRALDAASRNRRLDALAALWPREPSPLRSARRDPMDRSLTSGASVGSRRAAEAQPC